MVDLQGIFKGPAASGIHVSIEAPTGPGIIKPRPSRTHGDLVVVAVLHVLVKRFQILLSPIASIGAPAFVPGMHPSVVTVKSSGEFRRRFVLKEEEGRHRPGIDTFAYHIPVGMPALGKNDDNGPAVIRQIRV